MNDPYEREQRRLQKLFEEVPSGDEDLEDSDSVEDPYADVDGEFGSDKDYDPTADHSSNSDSGSSQSHVSEPEQDVQDDEEMLSSEESTQDSEDEWEESSVPIPQFNFDASGNCLKVNLDPDATPLDAFHLFFTPQIIDYLVECSNAYGISLTNTNKPKTRFSRSASFRQITSEELEKFLGLCLLQGQISTSNMRRYFSKRDILYFHPVFSYVLSGRRFEQILRVFCCSAVNSKHKEKIQPLIDFLIAQYQSVYGPEKELSIDESLLHFRGRLGFRVYIKNKKARYGIKFFILTTSDGYVLNMEMYSGPTTDENDESFSKTGALVLRLMKPFLLKGHELYMDNYYNSFELSQKLLELKTHTCGTLRSNRKSNPKKLVSKKLKRGDHYWLRKKNVYVSKWHDKRDVLMITTKHHPKIVTVKNRFGKEMQKPEEVDNYNQKMSGIDRSDQMTATYSSPRRTLRWYKKVIFHLMDLSVWNAFYVYRKFCKENSKKYRYLEFRDALIKSLLKIPDNFVPKDIEMPKNEPSTSAQKQNDEENQNPIFTHWPEMIPGDPSAKSNKKKVFLRCKWCYMHENKRRETSYRCKGCPCKPALCPLCFEPWHLSKQEQQQKE